MSVGPDITIRAHYDIGDEDRALADLDELYEDVWRQIQWTKEQG